MMDQIRAGRCGGGVETGSSRQINTRFIGHHGKDREIGAKFQSLSEPWAEGVRHESGDQAVRRDPSNPRSAVQMTTTQSDDGLAPANGPDMPDCLRREPMTVLQPASMTRSLQTGVCRRNSG